MFQSEKCNSSSGVAETFTLKMRNLISKVNLRFAGFKLKYFVGPKKYLLGSREQGVDVQFEHISSQPGRSFCFYIFVSPQTTFSFPEKLEVKTMMAFFLPVHFRPFPALNQGTFIIGTFSRMYFFPVHHMKQHSQILPKGCHSFCAKLEGVSVLSSGLLCMTFDSGSVGRMTLYIVGQCQVELGRQL